MMCLSTAVLQCTNLLGEANAAREVHDARPDLIAFSKEPKTIVYADMTIPFENGPSALYQAEAAKLRKYLPLVKIQDLPGRRLDCSPGRLHCRGASIVGLQEPPNLRAPRHPAQSPILPGETQRRRSGDWKSSHL